MQKVAIVIPNWNGKDTLKPCLDSLLAQTFPSTIIVVENGSTDGSLEYIKDNYPQVKVVANQVNLGFAGGVNTGIREAIRQGFDFVALFNNDAVADKEWLKNLVKGIVTKPRLGIVTSKLEDGVKQHFDSTGDQYTSWGLPFPRGRGEKVSDRYDAQTDILGASGGASLYRIKMLEEIGIFDEDFFAYYEDVDLSLRAQLAGWKVQYIPNAVAYHLIGATSSKVKGFTTYQTIKNLPWLLVKNIPTKYLPIMVPRFLLAYTFFIGRAITRGYALLAVKGVIKSAAMLPKKLHERKEIQHHKAVSDTYIWQLITHDLPPNAQNLRKLRRFWWKLRGKA